LAQLKTKVIKTRAHRLKLQIQKMRTMLLYTTFDPTPPLSLLQAICWTAAPHFLRLLSVRAYPRIFYLFNLGSCWYQCKQTDMTLIKMSWRCSNEVFFRQESSYWSQWFLS